jgi:hypothetical protein
MKVIGTVVFTAASEVEFDIPDDTPEDQIMKAISQSVDENGLPEVVSVPLGTLIAQPLNSYLSTVCRWEIRRWRYETTDRTLC